MTNFYKSKEMHVEQANQVIVLWSKVSIQSPTIKKFADEARTRKTLISILIDIDETSLPRENGGYYAINLVHWDRLTIDHSGIIELRKSLINDKITNPLEGLKPEHWISLCSLILTAILGFSAKFSEKPPIIIRIDTPAIERTSTPIEKIIPLVISPTPTSPMPMSLYANNVATRVEGNNPWSWKIFIQGSDNELEQVKCVEYTLHPTFPNPLQTICDKGQIEYPFALDATGWGTFEIKIKILLKDGRFLNTTHTLHFP